MTIGNDDNSEMQFTRGAWLTVVVVIAILLYGFASFAYRFMLPTDGWEVTEEVGPGYTYTRNLMGNPSRLQPGDRVIAVQGVAADWQTMGQATALQASWRTGATMDYTVIRGGEEIHVPVTLIHWQFATWLGARVRNPSSIASMLSAYFLLAVAAFVFLRRPRNAAAGAFLLITIVFADTGLSDTLPGGLTVWIDPLARTLQNGINFYLLVVLFPFAILRFAMTFPHPKPIQVRYPWLSYAAGAIGLILMILIPKSPLGWFWFVFSLILGVSVLIHNVFTMRDAVSRAQLLWGLGGLIIGYGSLAIMLLAGTSGLFEFNADFFNLASALATTVMGSMLAMAILRYRLFDIDVIIRRTVVYGLLSLLLALVYFGTVVLLQTLLARTTVERSPLIIVLSTLLIAALFTPLRARVQAIVDRRFYRRKYNAQQVLAAFAQTARDEISLEALSDETVRVVQETMQPEFVTLWLKP